MKCSEPFYYIYSQAAFGGIGDPLGEPWVGWGRLHRRALVKLGEIGWLLYSGRLDMYSIGQIGGQGRVILGQIKVDYVMGRLIWDYQESADLYLRVADKVAEGVAWELAEMLVGCVSADGRLLSAD